MKSKYIVIDKKLKNSQYLKQILINNDQTNLITFLNPFSYNVFLENAELIDEFDVFFADGGLLVKLHNLFYTASIDRVSFDFSSIASDVLQYANDNEIKIAFVGAKEDELRNALKNLIKLYPNLSIVYSRNGYFNDEGEYRKCIADLKNIKIDILLIGMGSPYQEKLAVRIKQKGLEIRLVFTCGGFLTQTSIKADYYHQFIKKYGLRWLQRAIMHNHVRKRLIKDYPVFVVKYIYNHIIKAKDPQES